MCALGHYAARPDMQGLLELNPRSGGLQYAADGRDAWVGDPSILDHFGLCYWQLEVLFDHIGCGNAQTPEEAARFIEAFVAADGAEDIYKPCCEGSREDGYHDYECVHYGEDEDEDEDEDD